MKFKLKSAVRVSRGGKQGEGILQVIELGASLLRQQIHTHPMKNRNITRYTYESTDFQGWRVSIQRCGRIITRYFSDLQCGSEEESYRQAVEYRDEVFAQMALHKNDLPDYMDAELAHLQELLRQKESGNTLTHPSSGKRRG